MIRSLFFFIIGLGIGTVITTEVFAQSTIIARTQTNRPYERIRSMLGTYEVLKASDQDVCLQNPRVSISVATNKAGVKTPLLYVGTQIRFPITEITKASGGKSKDCHQMKYNSFNDMSGWIEERQTGVCNGRRVGQKYRKITFDYEQETIRVITKINGKTDTACVWRKI